MISHLIHVMKKHILVEILGKKYWWRPSIYRENAYDLVRFGVVGRVYRTDTGIWKAVLIGLHPEVGYQPYFTVETNEDLEISMKRVESKIEEIISTKMRCDSDFLDIGYKRQNKRV